MMLTIHGLPPKFKFQDVKSLIRKECNISEFILDHLVVDDDGLKKIRVGLADGDEGFIVIKCLDRFRLPGNFVLTVVPVAKPATSAPPQNKFNSRPDFQNQPRGDYQGIPTRGDFQGNKPKPDYQPKEYQGNPRGDYAATKPRVDHPGNQRNEYHGNKPRTEMGGEFPGNKQRDGINQMGNQSREYPASKVRVEIEGTQGCGDYHGNQVRDFQGPPRNDYQGPPRDDFPGIQPRGEYQGSSSRDFQPREYQGKSYGNQGPSGPLNRPSPWGANAAGNGGGQWSASMGTQAPHNTFGYQQQPSSQIQPFTQQPTGTGHAESRPQARITPQEPQQPAFGFPAKSNETHRMGRNESRAHVLRSVDITEASLNPPALQARYPPAAYHQADKPVTIMKDNFQGPSQYSVGSSTQPGQYQGQPQTPIQPWGPTGQAAKPFAKSSPVQYEKPYDDRKYPADRAMMKGPNETMRVTDTYQDKGRFSPQRDHGRRISPDRRFSPNARRISPSGRRMSPSGRDMPGGRRISPSGRDMPGARRMSPSGRDMPGARRISPSGRDMSGARRMSPSGRDMSGARRMSPSGRDMPGARRISPSGRDMPGARRMSPSGRDMPGARRMSPSGRDMPGARRISPSSRDIPAGRLVAPTGRRISPSGRSITERQMSPNGRRNSPSGRRMSLSGRRISPSRRLVSPTGGHVSPGRNVKPGRDIPLSGRRMSPNAGRPHVGRQLVSPPRREARGEPPRHLQRYSPGRHPDKQADKYGDGSKMKQIRPAYEPPQQAAQNMYSGGYRGGPDAGPYPRDRDSWHRDREEREELRMSHPSPRKSRSPVRYKRHSPSPRSPHSPRRSWALEKRAGSPTAPPPPNWPPTAPDRPRQPVWDRPDNRYEDLPRPSFQDRDRRPEVPRTQKDESRDYHFRDDRRRESPRADPKLPLRNEIDRDFENIYKKSLEFKKRAEEFRSKSGERRRDFDGERKERRDSPRRDRQEHNKDWRRDEPEPKRVMLTTPRNTRDKAVEELATKTLVKYAGFDALSTEQKLRLKAELKLAISRRVTELFGEQDATFIEVVVRYQARYDEQAEQRLLRDVMASLPGYHRGNKRPATETSAVPAKASRWSADTETKIDVPKPQRVKTRLSRVDVKKPTNVKPDRPKIVPKLPASDVRKQPNNETAIEDVIEAELKTTGKPEGDYELNPLMTRVVEAELEDIMIKVWQELPDDPLNEAERVVIDKLRNAAGDDLRNVLGLNTTKRLLNVYNPLFVKIQFSGKPERSHLSRFLRKYNFTAFKRIDKVDMFAAQLRSINDFDRICTDKNIRCGDIDVTVSPCYRFTKCPSNLKTIFDDNADNETATSNDKPQEKQISTKPTPNKTTTKSTKVNTAVTKLPTINSKVETTVPQTKATPNSQSNTANTGINITSGTKTTAKKNSILTKTLVDPKVETKTITKTNPHLTETKLVNPNVENKTVAKFNPNLTETQPSAKVDTKTTTATNKTLKSPANTAKVESKTNTIKIEPKEVKAVGKPNPSKPQPNPKTKVQAKVETIKSIYEGNKTQEVLKTNVTQQKILKKDLLKTAECKDTEVSKAKSNKEISGNSETNAPDDFDELDDNDILALMSEGIVLDECSGSDEE